MSDKYYLEEEWTTNRLKSHRQLIVCRGII